MPGEHIPPNEGRVEAAFGAFAAEGTIVSLDAEARLYSVHEQIALQDAALRRWMARFVIPAFIKANAVTLIAIAALAGLDQFNIAWHLIAPGDRIIGGQVIMALLGATTVQVGTIAVVIARNLFPGRQP